MHPNDARIFLKQGYVEFGRTLLDGFDLKGGRFEFFDGSEYMPKELDPQLTWMVNNRIAQRLIGNFGFSDVMRSFDGAVASYGTENKLLAPISCVITSFRYVHASSFFTAAPRQQTSDH